MLTRSFGNMLAFLESAINMSALPIIASAQGSKTATGLATRAFAISSKKPEPVKKPEKTQFLTTFLNSTSSQSTELFHYVCFVPINNRLYELDGLQPYPIDHGQIYDEQCWTEKFKQVIHERINAASTNNCQTQMVVGGNGLASNEIRYNLMALVPDKIKQFENYLHVLCENKMMLKQILENKDQL